MTMLELQLTAGVADGGILHTLAAQMNFGNCQGLNPTFATFG